MGMCQPSVPSWMSSPSRLILRSGSLQVQSSPSPRRVRWVSPEGSALTQDFQSRLTSLSLQTLCLPHVPCLAFQRSGWQITQTAAPRCGERPSLQWPVGEGQHASRPQQPVFREGAGKWWCQPGTHAPRLPESSWGDKSQTTWGRKPASVAG